MCKVLAFTNTAKLPKRAPGAIGRIINKIERDGYGYAVLGDNGVFGEKSVLPTFHSRLNATAFIELPIIKPMHLVFGNKGSFQGPGIFHGRTSTNDKGLTNCHPMIRDGWHLIHNGVVTDHGPTYEMLTTNDSEHVLKHLIDGIQSVEANLTGYYAFAAIDPEGRLHVARDGQATLYFARVKNIDSYVIGTTETLIREVLKALDLKLETPIEMLKDNYYCIFKGNTLVHQQAINPRGYSYTESKHASASLGRSLSTTSTAKVYKGASEAWPGDYETYSYGYGEVYTRAGKARRAERKAKARAEVTTAPAFGANDDLWLTNYEIENMDRSYSIYKDGALVDLADFKRMALADQMECDIQRPDGTWVVLDDKRGA